MQLDTGNTLRGIAGTNSAITYTIFGDAITTVDTFKPLAQGQLSTSIVTLYTVPASTQVIIKSIQLANVTASDVTGVIFYVNGSASTNQINGGFTISAGGTATYKDGVWYLFSSTGSLQQTLGNLTGVITSNSNITSITSQTGSGTKFVVDNAPTFTNNLTSPLILGTNIFSIASSATTDLSTITANAITITGTTTITSFGTIPAGTIIQATFSGVLTITYNATSMITPTGINYTTKVGELIILISLGSGNWRIFPINYNMASLFGAPSDPTGTTNTTGLMMGLGQRFIPTSTGNAIVIVTGAYKTGGQGNGIKMQIRYGTGTSPANAAALTGSTSGVLKNLASVNYTLGSLASAARDSFTCIGKITGMTIGTDYWNDLGMGAVTGGTANLYDINYLIFEIQNS